jgi:hypothetical protein
MHRGTLLFWRREGDEALGLTLVPSPVERDAHYFGLRIISKYKKQAAQRHLSPLEKGWG